MVDYSHDWERPRRRARKTPEEIAQARQRRKDRRSEDDWAQYARDSVYRQLAASERCVAQVQTTLRRNDVPAEIAERVIAQFVDAGLIDDERFARAYVRIALDGGNASRRKLRADLLRKGVAQDLVEQALEGVDDEQELQAAQALVAKKQRTLRNVAPDVARRRIYGALARRGFSYDVIRVALATSDPHDDYE